MNKLLYYIIMFVFCFMSAGLFGSGFGCIPSIGPRSKAQSILEDGWTILCLIAGLSGWIYLCFINPPPTITGQ